LNTYFVADSQDFFALFILAIFYSFSKTGLQVEENIAMLNLARKIQLIILYCPQCSILSPPFTAIHRLVESSSPHEMSRSQQCTCVFNFTRISGRPLLA
jgi:hypothetical protein